MTTLRRVAGGLRPSLELAWVRENDEPENLTGANMSGTITDRQGNSRPIAGALTVLDGAGGVFEWAFDAADLATPGTYQVQFVANFNTAPTPAKSFDVEMIVQ